MEALLESGAVPDYLIGSSFGSILSSVVSRTLPVPIEEYIQWAKTVSFRAILGPERQQRKHGLSGVFALNFDQFADAMFRRDDGERMRMSDLAIPFDAVVAGVRKQPFAALPSRYRNQRLAGLQLRSFSYLPIGLGPQLATRLWQTAAFIDPRMVTPIVIGGDNPDRDVNVVDAASFSSAIPGVLHHETKDPAMEPMFDALLADNDVGALVDGGAASNVPLELAWKRIRAGGWAPATPATSPSTAFTRSGIPNTCGWCRSPRPSSCRWCATRPMPITWCGSPRPCRRSTWPRRRPPSTGPAPGDATASGMRSRWSPHCCNPSGGRAPSRRRWLPKPSRSPGPSTRTRHRWMR